jgi:Na+/H+ antiporter NhaD/arsenite permease-like protein
MAEITGTGASLTIAVVAIFVLTYLGMALGRFPGLRIDRTGIAVIAAIVLFGIGAVPTTRLVGAIDFPTLIILLGLMILSAQFAASGFYDWCSLRIAGTAKSPVALLAITVAVGGGLSAVLANDVVVFAMTPLLCVGLRHRGLDPRPFLIALAAAANCGSAATAIGNPQNILIAQLGALDFWRFLATCAGPAVIGLLVTFAVVRHAWRDALIGVPATVDAATPALPTAKPDRHHLGKAVIATALLLGLFATPLPQATSVLLIAGALLVSRRIASRDMLGMVDWHLLVLFAGLFVVTDALAETGLPDQAVAALEAVGLAPTSLAVIAPIALLGSNTIGNVPAVILILAVWPDLPAGTLYALAVLSTLAGNLLLVGSLANLIVVERAQSVGVTLSFRDHARSGVPITLISGAVAILWLWLAGVLPLS